MASLNKNGAILMKKHHAHAATDVTGFGLKGHSNYLAQAQKEKVNFVIHTLPLYRKMHLIDKIIYDFK